MYRIIIIKNKQCNIFLHIIPNAITLLSKLKAFNTKGRSHGIKCFLFENFSWKTKVLITNGISIVIKGFSSGKHFIENDGMEMEGHEGNGKSCEKWRDMWEMEGHV